MVEVRPASRSRIDEIAGVLGRAFVTEPIVLVSYDGGEVWDDALRHVDDDSTTDDLTRAVRTCGSCAGTPESTAA